MKRVILIALTLFLLLIPSVVIAENAISSSNPACHYEPFISCHSAPFSSCHSRESGNLVQGKPCSERNESIRKEARDPSLSLRVTNTQAESEISVLDSSVEANFPDKLVFRLEVESFADIVDARLHYQVDKMNYAQVTSEGWADFAPAKRVKTDWVWDMRMASLPPGAAITYWWTIEDAAGSKLETAPSIVYFDDSRYDWQSRTRGDLTLFWYKGDDSFAQELMNACREGLARLEPICHCEARSAEAISKPIKIYIYSSAGDLQGAMIFPMEWTGGVAFTEFGIIAIGVSPGRLDWGRRALVHELTHLVVHQATFSPYGRLPVWLDEGLAMYNEGEPDPFFQSWLEEAISKNRLISVRSLCSPFSAEPEKAYLSYAESYSLVEYLLHNYSQAKMLDLLTLLKQGSTYDEALAQVYGFDIDGLDVRWRESLAASAAIASKAISSRSNRCAVSTSYRADFMGRPSIGGSDLAAVV